MEGKVGLFRVPADVEITTLSGPKLYPIKVTKDVETFAFPSDAAPLMVLFDKGGYLLKSADFHKDKKEWLYQLKNAAEFADRADAVVALRKIKNDDEVVAALATSLNTDKAWGMRAISADALGRIGGPAALKHLVGALDTNDFAPVRYHIVAPWASLRMTPAFLPNSKPSRATTTLTEPARSALEALGRLKSPNAMGILTAAVDAESPDGFLRNAALRSLGFLGDNKATLSSRMGGPGKAMDSRDAAIASLGRPDKGNKEITLQIASYLDRAPFHGAWRPSQP